MSHGLKSLARELPKHGRYGDSIVAHINPQEAALLKALGGSGTINPTTGLPEFWGGLGALNPLNKGSAVGKIVQQVPGVKEAQNLGTQVFQPLEKAIVQPASNALVSLDKAVGKTIPGGWGTVGMIAGSAIGLPTWAMTGLGALNGSGVMHPGRGFNLQGAMMGGAMAYGMSTLGEYARAAVPTSGAESSFSSLPVSEVPVDAIDALNSSQGWTGAGAQASSSIPSGAIDAANLVQSGSSIGANGLNAATGELGSGLAGNASGMVPPPSIGSNIMAGNFGDALSQVGTNISDGIGSLGTKAVNAYDTLTNPETYTDFAKTSGENAVKTGEGIKNLLGAGEGSASAASKLASASTGISPTAAVTGTIYGGMGLAALEEQRNMLEQQKAANAITQAEYDNAMAEINRSEADARRVVAEHPFSTNPSRDVSIGDTYYGRTGSEDNLYARNVAPEATLYNMGGSVDGEFGGDDMNTDTGNMQNGMFAGGLPTYAQGGMPSYDNALRGLSQPAFNEGAVGGMQSFAEGGVARFLSGGGDGMSDDIPARINGKQEARLADGEFVIPADVVSHLGNGSSKAGAKQLYSMMDKVRSARTGTKKQGKQINPRKFLAA